MRNVIEDIVKTYTDSYNEWCKSNYSHHLFGLKNPDHIQAMRDLYDVVGTPYPGYLKATLERNGEQVDVED